MMWRPDRSVRGPDRPGYRDIDPLNRVFAEAFTDRYSRDGLVGVRVPQLNPLVWRDAEAGGLGSRMVRTGIEWRKRQGAATIGLETPPRTVDNIGLYSRIALVPGYLTVPLVLDVPRRGSGGAALLSRLGAPGAG